MSRNVARIGKRAIGGRPRKHDHFGRGCKRQLALGSLAVAGAFAICYLLFAIPNEPEASSGLPASPDWPMTHAGMPKVNLRGNRNSAVLGIHEPGRRAVRPRDAKQHFGSTLRR